MNRNETIYLEMGNFSESIKPNKTYGRTQYSHRVSRNFHKKLNTKCLIIHILKQLA